MSAKLHIALLGGFSLNYKDQQINAVKTPRMQELLAWLLLHRDKPHSRQHLAFLLWPDSTEKQARTNLRNLLYLLRNALPESELYLDSTSKLLQWNTKASFTLDVAEFEEIVSQTEHIAINNEDIKMQQEALDRAVSLYRGPLLPECYSNWIERDRERLHQTYNQVLAKLVDLYEHQRDYRCAIRYARKWTQSEPFNEPAWRRLMQLYAKNNDRADALQAYRECVNILREELNIEPAPETQQVYKRLLSGFHTPPVTINKEDHFHLKEEWPLVGRKSEWESIEDSWKKALTGKPQFLLVEGDPGIGKTRLGLEFMNIIRRQGYPVAYSRCYKAAETLNFGPIIDWLHEMYLKNYFGNLDTVWLSELIPLMPELTIRYPNLEYPNPGNSPMQQRKLFEAVARGITDGGKAHLLFVDDLQWCDQETIEFINYLFHSHHSEKLMILGTCRPAEAELNSPLQNLLEELRNREHLQKVTLDKLNEQETSKLALHVAEQPINKNIYQLLYRETEGHPFFVIEMVREDSWWKTVNSDKTNINEDGNKSAQRLPKKITDFISYRFKNLSAKGLKLIGLASVIGSECPVNLLQKVSELDEPDLIDTLEELTRHHILREHHRGIYNFTHEKFREVAYSELSGTRKQYLHERIASEIENDIAGNHEGQQSRLSYHYEQARKFEKGSLWQKHVTKKPKKTRKTLDPLNLADTQVGRYAVKSYLGGGGFGVVYKAFDTQLERDVVLKFLPPYLSTNKEAKRRLIQEAKEASALDHQNIATVYEIGETKDGQLYIAMAYYDGETLKAKIARGPLPVGEAVDYAIQITEGLSRAHRVGIVHRDLKPANFMVTSEGKVKIVDFGFAKAQQANSTRTVQALGTAAYMSPEQTRGSPLSPQTDLWSLGVVFYEMLTGQRPFEGAHNQEIIYKIRNDDPAPLELLRDNLPLRLITVVERCLEKEQGQRYHSTKALLSHLKNLKSSLNPDESNTESWSHYLFRSLSIYLPVALIIFGTAYSLTDWMGLPDWAIVVTAVLLVIGIPFVTVTAIIEGFNKDPVTRSNRTGITSLVKEIESKSRGWFCWSNILKWNALAFGGLALVVGSYIASRTMGMGPFATLMASGPLDENEHIVLADFTTQTVDSTLSNIVTDAFRVYLSQSGTVNLVDNTTINTVLHLMKRNPNKPFDYQTAREVAVREGIKAVIVPSINMVGSNYILIVRLVAANSERELQVFQATVQEEDLLFNAVQRLSTKFREQVGESLKSITASPRLFYYRTSSLEALKMFSKGTQAALSGELEHCISLMTDAITIDSLFAAAYWVRGLCYDKMDMHPDLKIADYIKAYELRKRMTDYGRIGVVGTYYEGVTGKYEKSIDVVETYLDLHPKDSVRNQYMINNLGIQYGLLGQYAKAEKLQHKSLNLGINAPEGLGKPSDFQWSWLVHFQTIQGKFKQTEEILYRWKEKYPSSWRHLKRQADLAFGRRQYNIASKFVQSWKKQERKSLYHQISTSRHLANIAIAEGKLSKAITHLNDAMQAHEEQKNINGYYKEGLKIATSQLWLTGDTVQALSTIDRIITKYPLDTLHVFNREYYPLAILFAQLGHPVRARDLFNEARKTMPFYMQSRFEYLEYRARGWIAIAEGRLEHAVVEFERLAGRPTYENQLDRLFALGLIYDRMGFPDKAISYYKKLVDRPFKGWKRAGWYQPRALERLGQLYEAQGNPQMAIQYYTHFSELWRNGDSGIQPRIKAAHRALSYLTAGVE